MKACSCMSLVTFVVVSHGSGQLTFWPISWPVNEFASLHNNLKTSTLTYISIYIFLNICKNKYRYKFIQNKAALHTVYHLLFTMGFFSYFFSIFNLFAGIKICAGHDYSDMYLQLYIHKVLNLFANNSKDKTLTNIYWFTVLENCKMLCFKYNCCQ